MKLALFCGEAVKAETAAASSTGRGRRLPAGVQIASANIRTGISTRDRLQLLHSCNIVVLRKGLGHTLGTAV